MIDYKNLFEALFEKVERMRTERPTAGTRFRLMGLAADVTEATEMMTQEVLERVTKEVVLDADTDIDYTETGERVASMVLTSSDDDLQEATQGVNDALATLSDVLLKIAVQLTRHRNNDEYARLYEQEKKRYLNSGTAQRARGKYTDWKDSVCYGSPSMEDIEYHLLDKVALVVFTVLGYYTGKHHLDDDLVFLWLLAGMPVLIVSVIWGINELMAWMNGK